MDQYIKNAIDTRKQVIDDYYSIPKDKEELVSSLFDEINAMGEQCADVMEFETRFQAEYSERYNGLFTQLKVKPSVTATAMKNSIQDKGIKGIAADLADMAATELKYDAMAKRRERLSHADPDSPEAKLDRLNNKIFQFKSIFNKKD